MSREPTFPAPLPADERISYGKHESQFFDLWRPRGPATLAAAVMIHGGFWRARYDLSHASHFCNALAQHGFHVANLEYRSVGEAGGGWPATFEDVVAGFQASSKYLGESPAVIGHSAGGHLALRLAVEPVLMRGVVALAPVANLQLAYALNLSNGAVAEFLGGTPVTVPERYQAACPSQQRSSVRRIVVHGTEDDTVPIALSRAFVEARRGDPEPPILIEIAGAGHFDLIDPKSEASNVVVESVRRLLGK